VTSEAAASPSAPESSRVSVLVLVAEPALRQALCEALVTRGYEVRGAERARDALAQLAERMPQLAVIDVDLPDASGLEVLSRVRALSGARALPVLLFAPAVEAIALEQVVSGARPGPIHWLPKPATAGVLFHAVDSALEMQRLRLKLEHARAVLDQVEHSAKLGTVSLAANGGGFELSREAARLFGLGTEARAASDEQLAACVAAERRDGLKRWLAELRGGVEQPRFELAIERDGAEPRALVLDSQARHGEPDRPLVALIGDARDREGAPARPRGLAGDLLDRDRFLRSLQFALARARARQGAVAVMCLDLHRFTHITAMLGRSTGEALLGAIAQRLQTGIRARDVLAWVPLGDPDLSIASLGGGEFVLSMELASPEDAPSVGRRLLEMLTQPFSIDGQELVVRGSLGIALFPRDQEAVEELLSAAQTAADHAKQRTDESLQLYSPSMSASATERMMLQSGMRAALERDEFEVWYQPKIEIASGRIVGVEALVRWRHPQLGMISPAEFVPLAEETGLILPIGQRVLERACQQNKAWQQQGIAPLRVAVNLSSQQFRKPDLYANVMHALETAGLDAQWLELELTESMLMHDTEATLSTLRQLKQRGVHVSIDDFGTGYSSLSYLRRFPIDALKIDQSFIREVNTNADDAAIATSIILMGRSLKLRVIAEGVETRSQLSFLRVMQCDEAQGYLFSKPVPAPQLEELLRAGSAKIAA